MPTLWNPSSIQNLLPGCSASGAACGLTGSASCAGANSDPVMYGFAGRSFNFIGDPGKIYSIISTQNLQVPCAPHCACPLLSLVCGQGLCSPALLLTNTTEAALKLCQHQPCTGTCAFCLRHQNCTACKDACKTGASGGAGLSA